VGEQADFRIDILHQGAITNFLPVVFRKFSSKSLFIVFSLFLNNYMSILLNALNYLGTLGIAGVRGRYGGILVVPPPKYPHITSLPRRFPKTHYLLIINFSLFNFGSANEISLII